jgi:uncharacterized RDD family membrane protein YckC
MRNTLTPATNPANSPAWKEEVNRRIAEHRCRKPASTVDRVSAIEMASNMSRRAQEAAARVAARYANAPSFGEALASEAREALRVAEEASRTALEARKVAENVLANLRAAQNASAEANASPAASAAAIAEPPAISISFAPVEPAPQTARREPADRPQKSAEPVSIHSAPDEPAPIVSIQIEAIQAAAAAEPLAPHVRSVPVLPAPPQQPQGPVNLFQEEWWKLPDLAPAQISASVETEPLPLADSPRELVAVRRVRPRLAEGPFADAAQNPQLSIFEVSPLTVATEPEPLAALWEQPNWPRMDAVEPEPDTLEELQDPRQRPRPAHVIEPAFLGRRLMALLMDSLIVSAATLGALGAALLRAAEVPSLLTLSLGTAAAFALIALFYLSLFFTLGHATPGMKYARLRFVSFNGEVSTRAQRSKRLAAVFLSVLPLGIGVVWSLFDDDHLCWHDRLSRTYLAHN